MADAVDETGAVGGDGSPSRCLHEWCVGRLWSRVDGPERAGTGEQRVGVGVETRERHLGIASPRRCEGAGEVVFFGDEVDRPVAHPPWFDQQHLGGVGEHVGEELVSLDQPRQPTLHAIEVRALGEPLPLLAPPRVGLDELFGASANVGGRHELARREQPDLVEVVDRALVVHAEAGQSIDLVAPQVDADRSVGLGAEHVDDRATTGELATMLDELFAAVAELDESRPELVRVDFLATPDDDRFDLVGLRPELLQ